MLKGSYAWESIFNPIYGKKLAFAFGRKNPENFVSIDLVPHFSRILCGCNDISGFGIL
jgi:hypothetical protein